MAKREPAKETDDLMMMMKMIRDELKKMNALLQESNECIKKLKERFV